MLVNVGLVDKEKAEKNVELKKKKPDYKPYEEEESVDDMVVVRLPVLKFTKCIKTYLGCFHTGAHSGSINVRVRLDDVNGVFQTRVRIKRVVYGTVHVSSSTARF